MRSSQWNRGWHNQTNALQVGWGSLPSRMCRIEDFRAFADGLVHPVSAPFGTRSSCRIALIAYGEDVVSTMLKNGRSNFGDNPIDSYFGRKFPDR